MPSESDKLPSIAELADEFLERFRRGEQPSVSEYAQRYPVYADEIREVFPGLAMVEEMGPEPPEAGGRLRATSDLPKNRLGDFRIIREVGRGGMGVVYEAEQISLERQVALKVLPRQLWENGKHARRFEREVRTAARLHHTHIVPVFGVGQEDGLHYYVMQFIEGLSLDEVLGELKKLRRQPELAPGRLTATESPEKHELAQKVSARQIARSLVSGQFHKTVFSEGEPESEVKTTTDVRSFPVEARPDDLVASPGPALERPPDAPKSPSSFTLPGQSESSSQSQARRIYWESVARIGVQTAEGLHYAHGQGVIHRDVKPSNLLLDSAGTIWITDFGLAKAADQQDLTHSGDVLGTLRYMAPEQFDGQADERSDVYSLGLSLYELLAFKPAFAETDRYRLVTQVTHGTPPRLRTLDRHIPRDLETIVHKAIDRDARQRYQSARELADDLQRYLNDEPIRARRISPLARLRRWSKRNPAGAAVAILLLVALVASCGATGIFLKQAEEYAQLAGAELTLRRNETRLRQQAQQALSDARRERKRADVNFAEAWSAVDRFYTATSQSRLLNVAGMQPLRRELLSSALDYYRRFIEQESGNPSLKKQLADAQLGLARISRELGQPEWRDATRNALTLYRTLSLDLPTDDAVRHSLAECYFWLDSYLQAVDIWERLMKDAPENAKYKLHLAQALNSLAIRHSDEQNYEAALKTHQRALFLRMELLRAEPQDPKLHADLGSTLNNIGVLLARKQRAEESLMMYRQAVEHAEFAFNHDPGNILYGRFLAISATNIAYQERSAGRPDEAENWFRKAAEVRTRIASSNPDVTSLQSDAYDAWRLAAGQFNENDEPEEAADAYRRAGDVLERLPQRTPDDLFKLACVYALASKMTVENGNASAKSLPEQLAEQRQLSSLALDALQRAVDAGFRDKEQLETNADLAPLRAQREFTDLLTHLETLSKFEQGRQESADPRQADHRFDLASAKFSIGLLKSLFDEAEAAKEALTQSAELRTELLKSHPRDQELCKELAKTHRALANLAWRSKRYADAREHWEDVFKVLEPAEGESAKELAIASYDFGNTLARVGMLDEALPYFAQRLELNPAGGLKTLRALYLAYREQNENAAAAEVAWLAVDRLTTDRQSPGTAATAVLLPLLLPERLEANQLNRLVKLAEQARGRATGDAVWARRTLGLAAFRAGRFEDALRPLLPPGPEAAAIQCGFVRAMALYRLDRIDEARRHLKLTIENQYASDKGVYDLVGSGDLGYRWHLWFIADHLRKEAETLILGAPRPHRALVSLHRARAYALLRNMDRANELFDAAVAEDPENGSVRLMRVRFMAEAGLVEPAAAEFAKARELFLASCTAETITPHHWRQLGMTARLCGKRELAADAFTKAVDLQSKVLRENPADVQEKNALGGLCDDLVTEFKALERHDEAALVLARQQELHETLAINPLAKLQGHAAPYVWSVAVLPDGRRALSAGQDGNVYLWDLQTGAETRRFEHHGPVLRIVCLPDGHRFLTAGHDTTIRLWDLNAGRMIREYRGHTDHVAALAVTADGSRAVSAGLDETLRVWNVASGEQVQSSTTSGSTRCVAVSPDGRRALTGPLLAESFSVSLWDVETGQKLRDFSAHQASVFCVAFSTDGRRAVSGDRNGLVVVWDLETGKEMKRWEEDWGEARDAVFRANGRIVLATGDGTLALLDAGSGSVVQRLQGNVRHYDFAILPNGRQVITGDADFAVRLWSLPLLLPAQEAAGLIDRQYDALKEAPEARQRLLEHISGDLPVLEFLVKTRPVDAQLKIARATAIAERGEWDASATALDVALRQTATVAQTGWWVTSAFPGELSGDLFPAEDNLNPFNPVGGSDHPPWRLTWKLADANRSGRLVLLKQTSDKPVSGNSLIYALRRIYAPEAITPLYQFRADNATVLWLNGTQLDIPKLAIATQFPVELPLKPGWNTLLVKVINYSGDCWLEMDRVKESDTAESQRLQIQAALLRGEWRLAVTRWSNMVKELGVTAELADWEQLASILASTEHYEHQKALLRTLAAWQTGDRSKASVIYRDEVAVSSGLSMHTDRLIKWRRYLDDLLEVEQKLNDAISRDPRSPEHWRKRAQFHLRRDELEQAVADYEEAIQCSPPTIVEPGWTLTRRSILPGASAAHFSPGENALYAGTRFGDSGNGIYRIDADGGIKRLCDGDKVCGLVVNPANNDVFFSEIGSGHIHRLKGGTEQPELWVSRFKENDSDPTGMAIAPTGLDDARLSAGDLLVVDFGWMGNDEIYTVSTRVPGRVARLYRDAADGGQLVAATDVTVTQDGIYLVDQGEKGSGRIFKLSKHGELTPVPTSEEIRYPVAITVDPLTEDLLVLSTSRKAVLRVNPTTGTVSTCISHLAVTWDSSAGLDVSPDGRKLFVTDSGASAIYTFARTPFEMARASTRTLVEQGRWTEAAKRLSAALDDDSEPCFFHTGWWVAGPYPQRGPEQTHFPPADNLDPLQPTAGANQAQPEWRTAELDSNGRFDFKKIFAKSPRRNVDCYLLTRVFSSVDQTVLYHFDADDRMQLWVNGESARLQNAARDVSVEVPLRKGWNTLLIKIWNAYGNYFLKATPIRGEQISAMEWRRLAASAAYYRGDVMAAAEGLSLLISESPGDADLFLQRAKAWIAAGDLPAADADLDRVVELRSDVETLKRVATIHVSTRNWQRAAELYSVVIHRTSTDEDSSSDGRLYFDRSLCYRMLNDLERALADVNKAQELDGASLYIERRAGIYNALGKYDRAEADCTLAIDNGVHHYWGYRRRADARFALKNFEGAFDDAKKALSLKPGDEGALSLKRSAQEARDDARPTMELEAELSGALEDRPEDVELLNRRARERLRAGKVGEALEDVSEAVRLSPKDDYARHIVGKAIGRFQERLKNPGDRSQAEQAAAGLADLRSGAVSLGRFQSDRKHWGSAAKWYAVAESWDDAVACSERYGDPRKPQEEPWYARAMILLAAGKSDLYQRFCEQLLELHGDTQDPSTAGLVAWIGTLAPDAVSDPEQLVRLAKLQLNADRHANHRYKFASALYRAGRYDESLAEFKETIKTRGDSRPPWDWMFLAMTHFQLGHTEEAREAIATANKLLDKQAPRLKGHELTDLQMLRREAEALLGTAADVEEVGM